MLRGYKFWQSTHKRSYNTPKNDKDKEIALYLTADSRLIVNSGVPDLFIYVKNFKSWGDFLKHIYNDPVQRTLIEKGPFYVQKIAREVIKDLSQKIENANFVFSITLFSLESAAIRLYMTIRLIQKLYRAKRININNKCLLEFINKPVKEYQKMFLNYNTLENNKDAKDPIIGNEKGLFYAKTSEPKTI